MRLPLRLEEPTKIGKLTIISKMEHEHPYPRAKSRSHSKPWTALDLEVEKIIANHHEPERLSGIMRGYSAGSESSKHIEVNPHNGLPLS